MMYKRSLALLSSLLLLFSIIVVVLGAYTRLVDAGLGCPDWPTCYGHLWVPDTQAEIDSANNAFSETPVETDKTWPEQIHRIFASSLGLLILILFALVNTRNSAIHHTRRLNSVTILLAALVATTIARMVVGDVLEPFLGLLIVIYAINFCLVWRSARVTNRDMSVFLLSAALACLVILQGLFGMWTVTLKLWPQVVTAHLLGGFATLSLVSLLWVKLCLPKRNRLVIAKTTQRAVTITLVLVVFQIALGGWTSSNYAALACPDLPTCQNQWLPEMDLQGGFNLLQDVGPNYLGGKLDNLSRVAIHYMHRVGALIVSLSCIFLVLSLFMQKNLVANRFALAISMVLSVQLALGVSNILFAIPLWVAVLHNAGGALLLILLVNLKFRETSNN